MNEKQPVSMVDVARMAGVSTATVSRVINKVGPISTATERSVRKAIAKLNYTPQRRRSQNGGKVGAAGDGSKAKRPFAFLWLGNFPSHLQHSTTNAVMMGLDRAARNMGRSLTVAQVPDLGQTRVRDVVGNAEGVLIRTSNDGEMIEQAINWLEGMPAVLVLGENRSGRTLIDHVTPDNTEVGILAAEYLTSRGCRHLVFASTNAASSVTSGRCRSFVHGARQRGATVDVVLHGEGEAADALVADLARQGVHSELAGNRLEMVRSIANLGDGRFGLFMPRDFELAIVMPQLQVLGVDFHNTSVAIGCDNLQHYLRELDPIPTSINLHVEHVAQRAIRRLNYRLTHPDEPRTRITVAPDIVLHPEQERSLSAAGTMPTGAFSAQVQRLSAREEQPLQNEALSD